MKNKEKQLFTHCCRKLSFCRDYVLFGGHFLLRFGGVGHRNILMDRVVEVAQRVELPLLTLDGDVELADTLKGELLLLDEDADGVPHEPSGHPKHLLGHSGGQQDHLFKDTS